MLRQVLGKLYRQVQPASADFQLLSPIERFLPGRPGQLHPALVHGDPGNQTKTLDNINEALTIISLLVESLVLEDDSRQGRQTLPGTTEEELSVLSPHLNKYFKEAKRS